MPGTPQSHRWHACSRPSVGTRRRNPRVPRVDRPGRYLQIRDVFSPDRAASRDADTVGLSLIPLVTLTGYGQRALQIRDDVFDVLQANR